jgi:hypothetical protein
MVYKIDYALGERADCSAQINIADRIFYTKHFVNNATRYFSADQQGMWRKKFPRPNLNSG